MNLRLSSRQHILWRHVTDRAVQTMLGHQFGVLIRTETGAFQMENPTIATTPSEARTEDPELGRFIRLCRAVLLFLMTVLPAISRAQVQG